MSGVGVIKQQYVKVHSECVVPHVAADLKSL